MKVLVFIEHEGGEVRDATLSAVTAAAKLGEVHGLVVGTNVAPVAEAAAKIAAMSKVHVAEAPHLEHALAENIAPIAAQLMEHHDAFVAPSTSRRGSRRCST
jgi:electron transfer flavoprotein alpha subunit